MTQTQKNSIVYALLGGVVSLLLLLFSPLGDFLRGDLVGSSAAVDAGLYMRDLSTPEISGTGALLRQDALTPTGELPVHVYAVTGSGNILMDSLSGVLLYDPAILSIHEDQLYTDTTKRLDNTLVKVMTDTQGKELGQVRFSVDKLSGVFTPREKALTLLFSAKLKNIDTSVSLGQIRLLRTSNTNAGEHTSVFLSNTTPQANIVSQALPLRATGLDISMESFNSSASGEVIKEIRTMSGGTLYTKESWSEKDSKSLSITHLLERYLSATKEVQRAIHTTWYPDHSRMREESLLGGDRSETQYDQLGREIRVSLWNKDGKTYQKDTLYDSSQKQTETWWYSLARPVKHFVTYQDSSTTLEEYTYTATGSAVTMTLTDTSGKTSSIENSYDPQGRFLTSRILEDGVGLSDPSVLTEPSKIMRINIPQGSSAKTTEIRITQLNAIYLNDPLFVTPGFEVSAISTKGKFNYLSFLRPLEVQLDVPSTTPPLRDLAAFRFNLVSNSWEAIPKTMVLQKDLSSIRFFTSTPGYFALKGIPASDSRNGSIALETSAGTTLRSSASTKEERLCIPSTSFKDISTHWASAYIDAARMRCIIDGKSTGIFSPEGFVTRAELTKIAINAFQWKLSALTEQPFADVSLNEWYAVYIATAKTYAMINGYPDHTFKPNAPVNRAEALKILLSAAEVEFSSFSASNSFFKDSTKDAWYAPYLGYAKYEKLVTGYRINGDTYFRPEQPITRAEVVKIIMLLLN